MGGVRPPVVPHHQHQLRQPSVRGHHRQRIRQEGDPDQKQLHSLRGEAASLFSSEAVREGHHGLERRHEAHQDDKDSRVPARPSSGPADVRAEGAGKGGVADQVFYRLISLQIDWLFRKRWKLFPFLMCYLDNCRILVFSSRYFCVVF